MEITVKEAKKLKKLETGKLLIGVLLFQLWDD